MPDHEPFDDDPEELDDDLDEDAAGPEVVCPRCGAVQLRAVSCRSCSAPLGQYAAARRPGLIDRARDGVDDLRERGLLLPVIGGAAAVLLLLLIVIIAVVGPSAPPPGVIPAELPAAGSAGARPAAAGDPDEVRPEDLEGLLDPRADELLKVAAPTENEPPFVAVNRIRSGVHGELHTSARYDRKLRKRKRAVVHAALPGGWTLFVSGPQVARLGPGQSRSLKPGRYELAAERSGSSEQERQPLFVLVGLKPGYRYKVSDKPAAPRKRRKKR